MNVSRITARVKAANQANAYGLELFDKLAAIFTPLVGQKVLKADGTLLEKYRKLLPEFPREPSVCRYSSDYSLIWIVKASAMDSPQTCVYHDASIYVAEIRSDMLMKMYSRPELRSNYTADEVIANIKAAQEAKKLAEDAASKCHPFEQYINGH